MVQEMSDRDLNLALAELMDYPKNRFVPNYCTDPAASLEVQKAAMKANPALYCDTLDRLVNPKFCEGKGEYWHETEVYGLIDVRPRERAEAAYITLSSKQ
jgi:hypothetical protein